MRKTRIIAIGLGALLLVLGMVWAPLVAPRLVRFPDDVDETLRYSGNITMHVDAATGAPLATPVTEPLTVVRRLVSSGEQTYDRARLLETITMTIGDTEQVERHSYVMDRASMKFVDDPGNWAYFPDEKVDRTGKYRITLPMDLNTSESYEIWNNETGAVYKATGGGGAVKIDGLDVVRFAGELQDEPLSPGFIRQQQLPATASVEAFTPQLEALGLDLAAVNAMLAAALTPEDAAAFAAALAQPVPLSYTFSFTGEIAVEPETGAIVALSGVTEGAYVHPDLSAFEILQSRLAAYGDDPVVTAINGLLTTLTSQPAQPVYVVRYAQTDASIAEMVDTAKSNLDQKRLAEDTIPQGLIGAGTVLYLGGLLMVVISKRRPPEEEAKVTPMPQRHPARAA